LLKHGWRGCRADMVVADRHDEDRDMNDSHSSGMLRAYMPVISVMVRLIDLVLIVLSLYLPFKIYGVNAFELEYSMAAALGLVMFFLLSEPFGLYRADRGAPMSAAAKNLALVWTAVVLVLLLAGYMTKTSQTFSRVVVASWIAVAPLCMFAWRICAALAAGYFRRKGYNKRRVAVAGAGKLGESVLQGLAERPWLGMDVVGLFDDDPAKLGKTVSGTKVLGPIDQALDMAESKEVDIVVVTLPLREELRVSRIISRLSDTTASLYIVPDVLSYSMLKSRWMELNGLPVVSLFDTPAHGFQSLVKRIEDVVLALVMLVLASPLMLLIALGIKLDSKGKVLFRQKRYGLDGREIVVLKFRTMRAHADDTAAQARRGDARVTRIGHILRQASLDELPQLFNVLMGEMSIVGPRPHAAPHNEHYRKLIFGYMTRHMVKPGITGWAQVNGWRGETEILDKMRKRVEFDMWYIRNWNLWLDFKIIGLTLVKGFINKNAY